MEQIPIIISAIGLIFIGFQIHLLREQIKSSTASSLYNQMIDIDQYFVEHPFLKDFIYGNKDIDKSSADYSQIRSVAEMMTDLFEHAYVQRNALPKDVWSQWLNYFANLYRSSPIIREHFEEESKDWYAVEIIEKIKGTAGLVE